MTSQVPDEAELPQIAQVLGRVPSGLFILVAGDNQGRSTGLLASWVQQASFDPPQVTVAVNRSRYLIDWLQPGTAVTINQLAKADSAMLKHFGRGFEPDADAFQDIGTMPGPAGLPLLTDCMTSLEGVVAGQMPAGDHVIFLVTITAARTHRGLADSEPWVHVRKNGLSY